MKERLSNLILSVFGMFVLSSSFPSYAERNPFQDIPHLPSLPAVNDDGAAFRASSLKDLRTLAQGGGQQSAEDVKQLTPEIKTVIEGIDVIGRNGKRVILSIPIVNSQIKRNVSIVNGDNVLIGNYSFNISISGDFSRIRIMDGESAIWERTTLPRKTSFQDVPQKYQPPLSAGYGVGQSAIPLNAASSR